MSEVPQSKDVADDGGSAFPESIAFDSAGDVFGSRNDGLSIRDWFAGKALVGLLVNQSDEATAVHAHGAVADEYAGAAYTIAAAMLAARAK